MVWDIDGTMIAQGHVLVARPHLYEALNESFQLCRYVGIWTAAHRLWCDEVHKTVLEPILRRITRNGKPASFDFMWSSDRCTTVRTGPLHGGFYYNMCDIDDVKRKPLKKFWHPVTRRRLFGASPHNMLIVDDTPHTYTMNRGNAMRITTFVSEHTNIDTHLLTFVDRLQKIVRLYNAQRQDLRLLLPDLSTFILELIHSYAPLRSVRAIASK